MTWSEVWDNEDLTIEAKAIYGMLCTYAGSGSTAYPSVELLCNKLKISRARFYKHLNLLIGAGIVKKEMSYKDGLREKCIYTLIPNALKSNYLQLDNLPVDNLTIDNLPVDNLASNNNNLNNTNLNNNRGKNITVSDETEPPEKAKSVKHKYGEYNNVLLTDEELEKLKAEYFDYEDRIEKLSSYVASTGKRYKSHYATIRNWARKDKEKQQLNAYHKQTKAEELDEFYKMAAEWAQEGRNE